MWNYAVGTEKCHIFLILVFVKHFSSKFLKLNLSGMVSVLMAHFNEHLKDPNNELWMWYILT